MEVIKGNIQYKEKFIAPSEVDILFYYTRGKRKHSNLYFFHIKCIFLNIAFYLSGNVENDVTAKLV